MAQQPQWGLGLLYEVPRSHSDTPHSIGLFWTRDRPLPLPDNTQHSQETDIHAPGRIRTRNPSKRAAVDPRLRPRGHRDRQHSLAYIFSLKSFSGMFKIMFLKHGSLMYTSQCTFCMTFTTHAAASQCLSPAVHEPVDMVVCYRSLLLSAVRQVSPVNKRYLLNVLLVCWAVLKSLWFT